MALIGIAALSVVVVTGALVRLGMGPVSVGPFSDKLREAIVHALPGLIVRYDDAAIEWSRDEGRVNLIITGARVFDPERHIIAQAPKAEVGLAAGPLIQGDIQVRRITLVGVQLTLVRTKDGALHLGVERDKSRGDVLERIRAALEKSGHGTASLEHLAVSNARLAFYDEGTGLFVVSPRARLDISSSKGASANGVVADIDADIEVTGQPAHVVGTVKLPRGGPATGDVSISGLQLKALAQNSKSFAVLDPFDLKTDISGSFAFNREGRLRAADLGIGASGVIGGLGSPLVVKSFRFVGRYDGLTGRVLIDDGTLEGQSAKAHFRGTSNLVFGNTGAVIRADMNLTGDEITLRIPGTFQQSVAMGEIGLRGTYTAADQTFAIDKFWLGGSPISGELVGRIVLAPNKSPEIDLNGRVNELSVGDLVRYWPLRVGEGARNWIAANIFKGRIGPIAINTNIKAGELDLPALPERAVLLSFPIHNATVNYIRGLEPLTHAEGSGTLTGDTFKATVRSARVGPLSVTAGEVVVPRLHVRGTTGTIAARVNGRMRDLLSLLDMKPLQYPTRFHLNPADTDGTATAEGEFRVPMLKNLSVDQMGIRVKASVDGLALTLGKSTRLSNGTGVVNIDNTHLHAVGAADLGRTRIEAEWTEAFRASSDITSKILVRGRLDEEAREALNFQSGDLFTGPVGVVAQLDGHRGSLRRAHMTLDLTPASISFESINYTKPPGVQATAQIAAQFDPKGKISAEDVSLTGAGGLFAQGTVNFAGDGELAHAEFPSVRAGPANDFSVSFLRAQNDALDVSVRGKSADGSALGRRTAKHDQQRKPDESGAQMHLTARLDRVVLREGVVLSPFNLDLTTRGGQPQSMTLSAGSAKGGQVSASIAEASGGPRLVFNASNAGDILKGVLGLKTITGGQISLAARLSSSNLNQMADSSGKLILRDFKIENQPFLARLFSAGSLGGLLDLMRGKGILIDELEMPFTVRDDVIDIRDGHASGPSIGISGEGYIDRRANRLELRGAVAPMYGINSVLGVIPLVGNVLVSREGEGIIGVTYTASGNADEPKISVNPLSVLTPGIFRRIFEGSPPSAPRQADSTSLPVPKPQQQLPH